MADGAYYENGDGYNFVIVDKKNRDNRFFIIEKDGIYEKLSVNDCVYSEQSVKGLKINGDIDFSAMSGSLPNLSGIDNIAGCFSCYGVESISFDNLPKKVDKISSSLPIFVRDGKYCVIDQNGVRELKEGDTVKKGEDGFVIENGGRESKLNSILFVQDDKYYVVKQDGVYGVGEAGNLQKMGTKDKPFVIKGSLDLRGLGLSELPDLSCVVIEGDFLCSHNKLSSLKGAPSAVKGKFVCSGNQLTSLEGAPQSVGGSFYCRDNPLTSLTGAPQSVGGSFYCDEDVAKKIGLNYEVESGKARIKDYSQILQHNKEQNGRKGISNPVLLSKLTEHGM